MGLALESFLALFPAHEETCVHLEEGAHQNPDVLPPDSRTEKHISVVRKPSPNGSV